MSGAVVLKSQNALVAGRSPVSLGDAFYFDANRAVVVGSDVNLTDYLQSSLTLAPIAGTNPTVPTSPTIQTVDGIQELSFAIGNGLAANYATLSGVQEVSMYLVIRANLASADANGVLFRWMANYTGVSATDKGFILRRSASTNTLQFLMDGGSLTESITQTLATSGYVVIGIGYSAANNQSYLNINGTEVLGAYSIGSITGGGKLSFGYSPDYATQRCPIGLRVALGFKSYHDAATRAAMISTLKSSFGIA